MSNSIIFRNFGDEPAWEPMAAGAFACGYPADIINVNTSERPDGDVVFVFGGPERHNGANAQIISHYEYRGTPVFMIDFSDRSDHFLIYKSSKKWLPTVPMNGYERRLSQGYIHKVFPRGSKVIVLGQGAEEDKLLESAIGRISAEGTRPVIYRRQVFNESVTYPDGCDGASGQSLEADINDAYAVVTHSSVDAHPALLRGIPVFCHEDAMFKRIAHPLHDVYRLEDAEGVTESRINDYFDRYCHIEWNTEELQNGTAFTFMHHFWK